MTSPFMYQPAPRFLQAAAQIGHKTVLWGGHTQDFTTSAQQKLAFTIEEFDSFYENWESKHTAGVPPPGLYAGACTTVSESLYYFGGYDGYSYHNSLHCLNSVTLEWTEIHSHTPDSQPMLKSDCGMVTYHDKAVGVTCLAVFAGFGKPITPSQPGAAFIRSPAFSDERGYTNEFHLFNLTNGM